MKWLTVLALGSLASALPVTEEARNSHVLHEKRSTSASNVWRRSVRVSPDAIVPVRIGLTQRNLEIGEDELLSISHPESPKYGQYYSPEEIHDLFAPSDDTLEAVRNWLTSSGIDDAEIIHSENKGWFALDLRTSEVERLFLTEIHEYEHYKTGALKLGCDDYHVPQHLQDHIDYITPGVKFSASVIKRDVAGWPNRPHGPSWKPIPWWHHHHHQLPPAAHGLPPDVQACGVNITPPCLRALYDIPKATVADPSNSPGFFEQGDYYSQTALDLYFKNIATNIPVGTTPRPQFIDGAEAPVRLNSPLNTGESDIDLEIAFSLVYPTIPTVYQVDDRPTADHELETYNLFNTFLDALDGSYCNYTAYGITGDSWRDPKYPDPKENGYKGQLQCGVYTPTKVISISYGEAEHDIPMRYDKRQCNEFMKLALQGHTILEASGDYGVASFPGDDTKSGCLKDPAGQPIVYNPDQLSSCPYITSVGATALFANQTVLDPESAMQVNLGPGPLSRFGSHGGFSNYFSRPSYQAATVQNYLDNHNPGLKSYVANKEASNIGEGSGVYNRAGRAFPDVSANGAFMLAYVNGSVNHWYGTSLSSPIWASVVTLLNQARSEAGKGPVGFINPTLYANPWALNDIVNGSNPNCGSSGFAAVPGWDPVTGLGTPNYPKLLELFMSLP